MRFCFMPASQLIRRPVRSALTAGGVALAVAGALALVGMSRGLENAWVGSLQDRGTHLLAVSRGSVELLTGALDERLAAELAAVPGVRGATGELLDLLTLEDDRPILVGGWPAGSVLWNSLRLVEGRLPDPAAPDEILAGRQIAEALALRPAGPIELWNQPFTVAGIFEQGNILNDGMLVFGLVRLQELLDRPAKVTVFHLQLADPSDPGAVARVRLALAERFPSLDFTESHLIARDNQVLALLRAAAWSTSSIALALALFFILNTLLMSVHERTRELGILSAVGWSGPRILTLIVLEGLILAAAGGALGTLAGLATVEWMAGLPALRGFIDPGVSAGLIARLLALTLLLGALGSLYPAWRAVRLDPVEALGRE